MPKIQMLKTAMGPNTRFLKGKAYEVSIETAKAMTSAKACITLAEHKKRVADKKEKAISRRQKKAELS